MWDTPEASDDALRAHATPGEGRTPDRRVTLPTHRVNDAAQLDIFDKDVLWAALDADDPA